MALLSTPVPSDSKLRMTKPVRDPTALLFMPTTISLLSAPPAASKENEPEAVASPETRLTDASSVSAIGVAVLVILKAWLTVEPCRTLPKSMDGPLLIVAWARFTEDTKDAI